MAENIYYLPGWGGQLSTGLGQGLRDRGFSVMGRESRGQFNELPFLERVNLIASDLEEHFWTAQSKVIANSFGGYLLLNALPQLSPHVGRILLLSPIIGAFENAARGRVFQPPYSKRLGEMLSTGRIPRPSHIEVHTGSEDWQSPPTEVTDFFAKLGVTVTIVKGRGHMLGADYVGGLLDSWLR